MKAKKIITKALKSLPKSPIRRKSVGRPRAPANLRTADPSCSSMAPPLLLYQPQLLTKKNMVTRITDHASKAASIPTTLTAFWNWTKSQSWLIWLRHLEIFPTQPTGRRSVVIRCWRSSLSKSNLRHKRNLGSKTFRSRRKTIIKTTVSLTSHQCRLKTSWHFQIGVASLIMGIASIIGLMINLTQGWWSKLQGSKAL